MPVKCLLCGIPGATCGPKTTTLPVDARVTGYKVAGDTLVPDIRVAAPSDLDDEEKEEFEMMAAALHKKSLRQQMREREMTMADGTAKHTSLSYVKGPDGITRKMHPDVARAYVEQEEGAEIVKEGALPVAKEGEIIGATKARVGEVFNADGTMKDELQPMTSRTFNADMRVRNEAVNPPTQTALSNEQRGQATSSTPTNDANSGTVTVPRASGGKPAAAPAQQPAPAPSDKPSA